MLFLGLEEALSHEATTLRWAFHDHLLKLALKHMEEASQFLQGQDDGEVGEGTDDELLNAQEVK